VTCVRAAGRRAGRIRYEYAWVARIGGVFHTIDPRYFERLVSIGQLLDTLVPCFYEAPTMTL